MTALLTCRLIHRFQWIPTVDPPADPPVDTLADTPADSPVDWTVDSHTDSLIYLSTHLKINPQICFSNMLII